ncbi:MAG: hypothetical protein M1591_09740, partial [Deltaproteobacteria bacterium]|nr:hypothetical protein [Deltaproteobacteria bacterium]
CQPPGPIAYTLPDIISPIRTAIPAIIFLFIVSYLLVILNEVTLKKFPCLQLSLLTGIIAIPA